MRSLWIASGLAFGLLVLAAALRPAPVAPIAEPVVESVKALAPLQTEDLSQILALRAEFGSPADRLGGVHASQAAFEDQLRQVAGLDEKMPDSPAETASPLVESQAVLRRAATELDSLANREEEAGRYKQADDLRSLGDKVRQLARFPPDPLSAAAGADKPNAGLIDNGPLTQAQ